MTRPHEHLAADPAPAADFHAAMTAAMDAMHAAMAAAAVSHDPDRDFLAMMIPHHAGAVEMARLVLLHGRDALVRELAASLIAGQQAEIAGMRARLGVLAGDRDTKAAFPAIAGTRGVPGRP